MPESYPKPRHDKILVRVEAVEFRDGLAVPQSSLAGKKYIVESVGSDVRDLRPGDEVLMHGEQGVNWAYLPGHKDLIIVHDECIPVILSRPESTLELEAEVQ